MVITAACQAVYGSSILPRSAYERSYNGGCDGIGKHLRL